MNAGQNAPILSTLDQGELNDIVTELGNRQKQLNVSEPDKLGGGTSKSGRSGEAQGNRRQKGKL